MRSILACLLTIPIIAIVGGASCARGPDPARNASSSKVDEEIVGQSPVNPPERRREVELLVNGVKAGASSWREGAPREHLEGHLVGSRGPWNSRRLEDEAGFSVRVWQRVRNGDVAGRLEILAGEDSRSPGASLQIRLGIPADSRPVRRPGPGESRRVWLYELGAFPRRATGVVSPTSGETLDWNPLLSGLELREIPGTAEGSRALEFSLEIDPTIGVKSGETRGVLEWAWRSPERTAIGVTAPQRDPRSGTRGLTWELVPGRRDFSERDLFDFLDAVDPLRIEGARVYLEIGPGWEREVRRGAGGPDRAAPFPEGLAPAVATLRLRGVETRVWLSPFALDPELVAEEPEGWLRDARGEPVEASGISGSLTSGLEGVVVDPTSTAGRQRLVRRMRRMVEVHGPALSGFRLGQLGALWNLYRDHAGQLELADTSGQDRSPDELATLALRAGISALRQGAPEGAEFLGDWGTPPEVTSALEATRPPVSIEHEGDLLRREALLVLEAIREGGLRPGREGCLLEIGPVGHPGGLRELAAFQALLDLKVLTGQGVTAISPTQMGEEQLEILEKRFRSVERALPSRSVGSLSLPGVRGEELPDTWILETRSGQILIGLMNWNPVETRRIRVDLEGAGLASRRRPLLIQDRHAWRALGRADGAIDFWLPPRSSRLLSLEELTSRNIVLTGDSLHWLGSPDRLESEIHSDDDGGETWTLTCELPRGWPPARPVVITALLPEGLEVERVLRVTGARNAKVESRGREVSLRLEHVEGSRPVVVTRLVRTVAPDGDPESSPGPKAELLAGPDRASGGVRLEWSHVPGKPSRHRGYSVYRDGERIAETTGRIFVDRATEHAGSGEEIEYSVIPEALEGPRRQERLAVRLRPVPAMDLELADLAPHEVRSSSPPRHGLTQRGQPIDGGGLGVVAPSRLSYELGGRFASFRFRVKLDRETPLWARVRFRVELDGEKLWESEVQSFGDPAVGAELVVRGGRRLELIALSVREDRGGPVLASWIRPVLTVDG